MGRRSRGGGRPANHVRQLVGKASEEAVLKLREIAINEKDRYPGDEQLAALRILAGLLPKMSASE